MSAGRRTRYATGAGLLILAVAGSLVAATFGYSGMKTSVVLGEPDYKGRERGDAGPGGARILIWIEKAHGANQRAIFQLRRLEVNCGSDLQPVRITLDPLRVSFKSARTFRAETESEDPNGDLTLYKVVGHLVGDHRARGSFDYTFDSAASPGAESPQDCSTFGPGVWKAQRVR